jgi:hypothetical protein
MYFHPDRFLKYHAAYQPFVTKARQVFVVAWNILHDDYDDVPDLVLPQLNQMMVLTGNPVDLNSKQQLHTLLLLTT